MSETRILYLCDGHGCSGCEEGTNVNTLFNMDKVNISEPLLITEGEFDCLSAIEAGFKNAVSIPSGVNSTNEWINTNWTFLEQFKEIILWFDNDDPGRKGAREVYSRLSNNSVKIVNYTKYNDINEVLYKEGKEEILEAIEKAQTPIVEGIYTLDNIEDFNIYEAEKLKTGFEAIDEKIIGSGTYSCKYSCQYQIRKNSFLAVTKNIAK